MKNGFVCGMSNQHLREIEEALTSHLRFTQEKTMTGLEAKKKLRAQGITLTAWAQKNGFPYPIVSGVLRGVIKGNFGVAHNVAVQLGMKKEVKDAE